MESYSYKKYAWYAGVLAAVCVAFGAFAFGLSNLDSIKHPNGQVASISVSGEGEVTAAPDIATVNFTVRESAKTVPEAQKLAEAKIASGLKELEALGVDKKDTKTLSYTVNPKYESQQTGYCNGYVCPPAKTVINGYEVAQSVVVKVRKVEKAGEVIGALGKVNITEISGPEFTVDDMDKAQAEAKAEAIKNAQAKAEATAKALGSVIVVHDEIDVDFGQVRMRVGGSSAGHNGIKSVTKLLGSPEYGRVRVGIGPKTPTQIDSADFVLQKFSEKEQASLAKLTRETTAILSEYAYGTPITPETRSFL
jgi:uncharacterized protein YggE